MHKRSSSRTESSAGQRSDTLHILSSSCDVKNELIAAGAKLYNLVTDLTVLINEVLDESKGKEKGENLNSIALYTGKSIMAGVDLANKLHLCSNALRDSTALVSLLRGVVSSETETEVQRASGKVDRALERLRRSISSFLDRSSCTNDQVFLNSKELFSVIIDALNLTISEVIGVNIKSNSLLTQVPRLWLSN